MHSAANPKCMERFCLGLAAACGGGRCQRWQERGAYLVGTQYSARGAREVGSHKGDTLTDMDFTYFSHNGTLKPAKEAVIPLANIEYSYGFGVYENIRVTNGVPYFLLEHIERLGESARIIGLEHQFSGEQVDRGVRELIARNSVGTCNLKVFLVGAPEKDNAQLFLLCLNPLFPGKTLYRDGATFVTYEYERPFPHAKTLNMLQSYLAYRKAKQNNAYDALLIDNNGCIVEGTRTNFFCITGRTLISAPEEKILLGVTRKAVLSVALKNNFSLQEREITWSDIRGCDGAFVTSTSSKIIPVRSVDDYTLQEPPVVLRELMKLFDDFLDNCKGVLS